MKAKEGSNDGNKFCETRTDKWVDHTKETPTTGASDSTDNSTVCAGVSEMSPDCGDENFTSDGTSDEGNKFTVSDEDGNCDNGDFDHMSAEIFTQGRESTRIKQFDTNNTCLLYTSPSPRDLSTSRMPSSA